MATARRVTVIAHELRGVRPVGGMGTATTFLALALARQGQVVEILLGKHALDSLDPSWADVYRKAGVSIREAPRSAEPVEPWHFQYPRSVELGLRASPSAASWLRSTFSNSMTLRPNTCRSCIGLSDRAPATWSGCTITST